MNVPKYLWPKVVLTASYLINRIPTVALTEAIPLRRLCPDCPMFHLPPRMFRCICFMQDLLLWQDFTSFYQVCFLGYSSTQKGYRCYNPTTRRYIIFANVTFFESTPFFDTPTTNQGHVPLPTPVASSTTDDNWFINGSYSSVTGLLSSPSRTTTTSTFYRINFMQIDPPPSGFDVPITFPKGKWYWLSYFPFYFLWLSYSFIP